MNEPDDDLPPTGQAEYDKLPPAIKHLYTPKQFAWLSDAEKATLVQRETEPEWEE